MTDSGRYDAIVVGEGTTVWYALRISVGRVCGRLFWSAATWSGASALSVATSSTGRWRSPS